MLETTTTRGTAYTFVPGGRGTPLLFVHGQLGTRATFDDVMRRFRGERPLAALDLPWHGASPRPTAGSFDAFGDAVLDVLDALGWHRVVGVGHSLGTMSLLQAALRGPERFERLALVACPGDIPPDLRAQFPAFATMLGGGIVRAHAELAASMWYAPSKRVQPGFIDALHAKLAQNDPAAASLVCRLIATSPTCSDRLHRLRGRVAFLTGVEETTTPIGFLRPFAALAGADVTEVPGAHFPMEDAPDAFEAALRRAIA